MPKNLEMKSLKEKKTREWKVWELKNKGVNIFRAKKQGCEKFYIKKKQGSEKFYRKKKQGNEKFESQKTWE